MSSQQQLSAVRVDLGNPGQFLACCGLLELADRVRPGSQGVFQADSFHLIAPTGTPAVDVVDLLNSLLLTELTNSMTSQELVRLAELSEMKGSALKQTPEFAQEKKQLEKLRREAPLLLRAPFNLNLDWFQDATAGGNRFKTWAGQQSVLDIAQKMQAGIGRTGFDKRMANECLSIAVSGCGLPFNFDATIGGQGSALDIGFSLDPLSASELTRLEQSARPCLELLAFIGLQRFRPWQIQKENRYVYCAWHQPLPPELAAPAACGLMPVASSAFEFRLLYRTQYLKSFLPAIPYSGELSE